MLLQNDMYAFLFLILIVRGRVSQVYFTSLINYLAESPVDLRSKVLTEENIDNRQLETLQRK